MMASGWWILGLLLATACALAEDGQDKQARVSAVFREYGHALGYVQGEGVGMPILARLCADIDPAGREEFTSRLAQWRERNQELFDDVRKRFEALKKYDSESKEGIEDILDDKKVEYEKVFSETFQSMSAFDARLACRQTSLDVAERDLEQKFSKQLAVIRAFPQSLEQALK
jgi:hypothetical protein